MQDFFNWQGVAGTIFGLLSILFSILAWRKSRKVEKILENEKARLSEKIKVVLTNSKDKLRLPEFRRQEFTRGEIQGRLGTIPMRDKGNRYSIEYTNKPEYYEQINQIIEGSHETAPSILSIKCTDAELAQFAPFSDFEKKITNKNPTRKTGTNKKV